MTSSSSSWLNLTLATLSFTLWFAAWGLISAFAPAFRSESRLSASRRRCSSPSPSCSARWPGSRPDCSRIVSAGAPCSPLPLLWARSAALVPTAHAYNAACSPSRFSSAWRARRSPSASVQFPLVSAGQAGHGTRRLRPRQHRPFSGRVPRARGRGASSAGDAVFYAIAVLMRAPGRGVLRLARNAPRHAGPRRSRRW